MEDRRVITGPWPADEDREITIRRLEVRHRILEVAKRRFAQSGYDQVTLEDVASRSDLDGSDFRRYFQDKSGLLNAVAEEGWKDLLPRLSDVASRAVTAHGALMGMFSYLIGMLQKDEDLVRLLLFEGLRPDPQGGGLGFATGYRRFLQLCRDLVLRGQKDGSFRARHHPQVAASMLLGAFEGMLRDRFMAMREGGTTPYTGAYLMSALDALVSSLQS